MEQWTIGAINQRCSGPMDPWTALKAMLRSNLQIRWDWDGIYYEYWYWIFFFLSGLLIVNYFGFEGGTHPQGGFLAKSLLPNDNRLLDF